MLDMAINGPSDIEIVYEILLQGYLFCGYPKAIESFFCLDGVLRNKKLSLHRKLPILMVSGDLASSRGMTLARKIHRDKFSKIHNKISALCPDLGYLMLAEGYGHILSRNGAELATRELAVISSLSASAAFRQLNSHIRGAMNIGCDRKEILEAILTGLPWVGATAVRNSLTIWSKVLEAPIPSIGILKKHISKSV
jgi:4-carboxymuconolactone decarboxylase